MSCTCTLHFDQQLLNHIKFYQNSEAKLLLNKKLVCASDCRGTLLHRAAAAGNEDIAKHLIDMGSFVDSPRVPCGKTPLMLSVERSREAVVRVLLELGADINVVDADGKSALHMALHSRSIDFQVVEAILLRMRAETPLTEELIERLLAAGCAFLYFLLLRDVDILENLLQRGFDVNEKICMKQTALHLAALIKDFKLAELLVARGIDVNAADDCSARPLYYAAEEADPDMMRFLLNHGADPDPDVRFFGQMPLYVCFIVGENDAKQVCECAELLLKHGTFPWRPRTLVQQIQLCFDEILRSSRLNSLVAHQAALDAIRDTPSYEEGEHLTTYVDLRDYYDKCREILEVEVAEKMTVVKLLFVDNDREIKLRARCQTFVCQVEQFYTKSELKDTFPYYAKTLAKQIGKAVHAVELERRSILVIYRLFKCDDNQLSIFARQVVGYLSKSDLEQLCRV